MIRNTCVLFVCCVLGTAASLCGQASGDNESPGWRPVAGVSQPVLVEKTDAEYPEAARAAGIEGKVVLQAVIDETGAAAKIEVAKSLGYGLDEAAIEAVSHWRFQPGMKDGKAVSVRATIEVEFSMSEYRNRTQSAGNAGTARPKRYPALLPHSQPNTVAPRYSFAEAVRNTRRAAEAGYPPAARNLGLAYERGEGVSQDYSQALSWYLFAALRNEPMAQNLLGMMYAKGRGVRQSYVEAYVWFRLAARNGEPGAEANRSSIGPKMTPEDIEQAERRAGDWRPTGVPREQDGAPSDSPPNSLFP
jgi:TonB family protein